MISNIKNIITAAIFCCMSIALSAQEIDSLDCDPLANLPVTQGDIIVNYGSVTNSFSFQNKSSYTVAQPLIGTQVNQDRIHQFGFWNGFLLPPTAPQLIVSQGDFPDRVLIKWEADPLSPVAEGGYSITRDGAFLGAVDETTDQFIDFNVQAGEIYEYGVYGKNQYGNGSSQKVLGFVNPNGTITGLVKTFSQNPVPGAIVRLSPSDGMALQFDGVDDHLCVSYNEAYNTDMLTLSAWVKMDDGNDQRSILDLGSHLNANIAIKTTPSSMGKGVQVSVGDSTDTYTLTHEFSDDPDEWHQVAVVYASGSMILYVDGNFVSSMQADFKHIPSLVTIGSNPTKTEFFKGAIDDVRVYNRPLTGSEIYITKNITVSNNTSGLISYWKFDEGQGSKTFDITDNNFDAFINGATYTNESADVVNAGMTDETGFYSILGINYSQAENFKATPEKIFYSNYSLEFNRAYESHVDLAGFDLPDSSTIETIFFPFDEMSSQIIINNGNNFSLGIEAGMLQLTVGGETQDLGPVIKEYQHIALVMNGSNNTIGYYNNGNLVTTLSYGNISGDWSSSEWKLGSNDSSNDNFFTGLIDEVSFYKNLNSLQDIQLHASTADGGGTTVSDANLLSYFDLNEGVDNIVYDAGPAMVEDGSVHGASYSIITYTQEEFPHVFSPGARVVTINTSNTAASGIDFTDESTVPVSGVIRFENTFCYQDSVEILVNGQSYSPPAFTDSLGRFVIDMEPGATATLTPSFGSEDRKHNFTPAFHRVIKLNRPISNTLFSNQTKRKIIGQLSGGDARLAATAMGETVRLKVAAVNECIEEEITLDNLEGNFEFKDLPAVIFTTALVYHDNPIIYNKMQEEGAKTSNMRDKEIDTLDFRYYSDPKVEMEMFDEAFCPNGDALPFPYIYESGPDNGFKVYNKTLRMYEDYAGGRHYLENYNLVVTNNLNDELADTIPVRDTSAYRYEYVAGQANIGGDFTKFLQVEGISPRNQNDVVTERIIVLGEREREASFATTAPTMPLLILRNPPGDGSSATWEKGDTYCNTWSNVQAQTEGGEFSESLKIGGDIEFSTGVGVSKTTKIELENTTTIEATFETSATSTREGEFCMTATQTITTSDSDAVPTEEGDVYYGAAVNMKFSGNDVLYLDVDNCEIKNDSVTISVAPSGFDTEYIYSGWQLRNTIIPNLLLIGDQASADAWQNILDYNQELKDNGYFEKNISFDGLTTYSESKQVEQTESKSFEYSVEDNGSIAGEYGLEVDGIGYGLNLKASFGNSSSNAQGSSNSESSTTSYTMADDDPNDSYTVDILQDPVMGTPYYRLVAGETMCPWIPGTLNREEIGFQIDRVTAVNVPENEAAVFNVEMSNLGQTGNDPLVYIIGLKQGSNPDGAVVTVDGEALINPVPIQLQPGETKQFLVAVEKGPDVNIFNYSDIGIFVASECQYDHSLGLGYNLAAYADWEVNNDVDSKPLESDNIREGIYNVVDLQKFYKQFLLNVEYIEPCSRVNVGFPLQDWVQTPDLGNNLVINLNDYNNTDPDLELIRVQYRRTGGDGAWINITEVPKSELNNPLFYNVTWDMSPLADGPYEIRALAICFSGLNPGISNIVQGRKETSPPEIFGTPEPADGILSPGDEISIEFTKRINCNKVFQADGNGTNINLNNIALQDMTLGGILVDASITCKDEKIFIVPNVPNQFIENHTLRATATDIEDLYGNMTEQVYWEFFVNRSNLYWVGGAINEVTLEGNEVVVTREIRNQSGETTNFELYDVPEWIQVFPKTGTLEPGASIPVTFRFADDLVISDYDAVVNLSELVGSSTTPNDGNEPLKVDLRVTCPDPAWSVDASEYSFSMNFVLELDIEGVMSTDLLDQVGAFVDGELRGVAYVEYQPSIDKYLAFLTVYSNQGSGETVEFRIWDTSICQLYANILESFPYAADGLIGTPNETQVIHTDGQVLRKIEIHPGWNWISFNVDFPDPQINTVLEDLTNPSNALIKDQVDFSSYSDVASSWFGTLGELGYTSLYQYKSAAEDSMFLVGYPVDETTPIPLVAGWNWISYLPQVGKPINEALASLTPLNGDVIKSQLQFAVYVAGTGWVGNLDFLSPPNGYLINLSEAGTLTYPETNIINDDTPEDQLVAKPVLSTTIDVLPSAAFPFSYWSVDPTQYEYSMNLIGVVLNEDNLEILEEGDEVGVFVNGEVRGSSEVEYIEELDAHMIFLTIYANEEGEELSYVFYDASEEREVELSEKNGFTINSLIGSVDDPYEFNLNSTTNTIDGQLSDATFKVGPNPFTDRLMIDFVLPQTRSIEITVTDVLGNMVDEFILDATAGKNHLEWRPETKIVNGTYMLTFNDGVSIVTRKVLFIK